MQDPIDEGRREGGGRKGGGEREEGREEGEEGWGGKRAMPSGPLALKRRITFTLGS